MMSAGPSFVSANQLVYSLIVKICSAAFMRPMSERDPERARLCGNLAASLRTPFDQSGDTALLDEALFGRSSILQSAPG
jgi:hypothetical protein